MAGQERTEAATPRRRQEARQRGQVARSPDLTGAVAAFGGLVVLTFYSPTLYERLAVTMRHYLGRLDGPDLTQAEALSLGLAASVTVLLALVPVMLGLLLLGVSASVLQVGFLLTSHTLRPDLSRLNPLAGLGRICSPAGLVELGKSAAKALVIGFIGYRFLEANRHTLLTLGSQELWLGVGTLTRLGLDLALQMAAGALVLAALDYGYQRFRLERQLRMTRHEMTEELKQTEGNPHLKGRLRDIRRRLAARRMMQAVPQADVVVTNPTHLAVALRYDGASMRAPEVVAKGEDLMAQRIKEVARQHGVPLVENRPLAQALYKSVEIGMAIPSHLFQAVAEVLAFVYSLREGRGGR